MELWQSRVHRLWTRRMSWTPPRVVHRLPTAKVLLSTASPHRCPLFGNEVGTVTGPSERRHTEEVGWAVGKLGKTGDNAGENQAVSVYRLCRTLRHPQSAPVVHCRRPQDRWTKNGC